MNAHLFQYATAERNGLEADRASFGPNWPDLDDPATGTADAL